MSPRPRSPAAEGTSASRKQKADPYYGQEETATLCANFVTHLFACPELPPHAPPTLLPLQQFIAYALRRTKLPSSVIFAGLYLLERLKSRFPDVKGTSGHRLFITAYIIASKVILDASYWNKTWAVAAHSMFPLKELNQMEREVFEAKVRRDFKGPGPYPTYVLPAPVPSPTPFTTPRDPEAGDTPPTSSPAAGSAPSRSPSASPMDLDPLPVYASPPPDSMSVTPSTLRTPELWGSTSASPASAALPATPAGYVDHSVPGMGIDPGTIGKATTTDLQVPTTASCMPGTSSGTTTDAAWGNPPVTSLTVANLLTHAIACVW